MKYVPKELGETADISRGRESAEDRIKYWGTVLFVLVGGYLALGLIADFVALHIPNEWEAKMSPSVDDAPSSKPHARFAEAQTIFDALLQDPEVRPLPYRLIELSSDAPNAMAFPGGLVGVTTGLLDEVSGKIGLAFVLGHELGHHRHRHALKGMGRSILQGLAFSWAFGDSGVSATDSALNVASRQHSQRAELEADAFGLAIVQRTYGTTDGATQFFEWARTQEGEGTAAKLGSWLSTHPLSAERIRRLDKLSAQLQQGRAR